MSQSQRFPLTSQLSPGRPAQTGNVGLRLEPQSGSLVFFLLRVVVLFAAPFLVVTGALFQIEMFLTGGNVPFSPAILKASILAVLLTAFILRLGTIRRNTWLFTATLLFFGYLVLDSLYLYFGLQMKPSDIILSYNGYYTLMLLAVLATMVPLRISSRRMLQVLGIMAVASALLGLAQFIERAPIVPVVSTDQNFRVLVWQNGNEIRIFSLFDEPAACGLFFVFCSALLVVLCRNQRFLLLSIPLLPVSIFLCLASVSRTEIIALACALIASLVFAFWSRPGRTRFLPIAFLLSAAPVAGFAYFFSNVGLRTHSVTDTASFTERIKDWSYYISTIRAVPLSELLFGIGMVQNRNAGSANAVVFIDNIYLSVGLHIGLVGLSLFLLLAWFLWEEVRKRAEERSSPLAMAIAATYSTFFLLGVFTNMSFVLPAYFLLNAVCEN